MKRICFHGIYAMFIGRDLEHDFASVEWGCVVTFVTQVEDGRSAKGRIRQLICSSE